MAVTCRDMHRRVTPLRVTSVVLMTILLRLCSIILSLQYTRENSSFRRRACGRFSPHMHIYIQSRLSQPCPRVNSHLPYIYIPYIWTLFCNCSTLQPLPCYKSTSRCSTTSWCHLLLLASFGTLYFCWQFVAMCSLQILF